MNDYQVLANLKAKRKSLILELERVTLAIHAYELPKRVMPIDEHTLNEEISTDMLMYEHRWTLEEKVFYVLTRLGSADAIEIANYILILDKEIIDKHRVYKRITFTASKMYVNGLIDCTKFGKRNVYRLIV